MGTRTPRRLAGAALVTAMLVGGCGGAGTTTSEAGGSDSPTSAVPASSTTAKTQPARKLRSTPECAAVYKFNLALFYPAVAPEEKRNQLIDLLNRQVNATREQLPQFGEAINQQVLALRKDLVGTATSDDKAKAKQAQQQMSAWYEQNCVEGAGATAGSAPSTSTTSTTRATATTTTAKPATTTTTAKPATTTTTRKR